MRPIFSRFLTLHALFLSLFTSSMAMAQIVPLSPEEPKIQLEERNKVLVVKPTNANTYPLNVIGMNLDAEESMKASQESGAVAQYIIGGNEVDEYGMDKKALSAELNDMVKIVAQYFKNKPEYKGTFVAVFNYYPGYKKPFQYDISPNEHEKIKNYLEYLNDKLKERSQCNSLGFCSLISVSNVAFYNPEQPEQQMDKSDFGAFADAHTTTQNTHIYHTNPKADKPVIFVVYHGVNGYLTTREFVKEHLKTIAKP